jgi:hypothetical protein
MSVKIPVEISDAPEWNSRDRHSIPIVSPPGMHLFMASDTQRDQVFFGIVAGVAAKLFVVDFQVQHRAARLTPPAIATQHLQT